MMGTGEDGEDFEDVDEGFGTGHVYEFVVVISVAVLVLEKCCSCASGGKKVLENF
jgi:hypothetical protein